MTEYRIVPATDDHAVELAKVMRAGDVDEVWASGGYAPLDAVRRSLQVSREAWTALADGRVICMFGIGTTTALSATALTWMLGTEELPRHYRIFLRVSRHFISEMLKEYTLLCNYVDARNTIAIRWLRWLGYTVEEAVPFGVHRLPFHYHWISAPCAN